ncbi:MAG: FHA domain-containing protein [Galbitalea sp.]
MALRLRRRLRAPHRPLRAARPPPGSECRLALRRGTDREPVLAGPAQLPTAATAKQPIPPAADGTGPVIARRLVITSGPKEGLEIELPTEQLAIGRSSESGLVIRDDYTSTHHARLLLWNDGWVVQDLDSTNGTFLDGTRVTLPTLVPLGTPVTIGTTTFELRR